MITNDEKTTMTYGIITLLILSLLLLAGAYVKRESNNLSVILGTSVFLLFIAYILLFIDSSEQGQRWTFIGVMFNLFIGGYLMMKY